MVNLNKLLENYKLEKNGSSRKGSFVRIRTSWWSDSRGVYERRAVTWLRRLSDSDFHLFEADVDAMGAEDSLKRIINLGECEDGIYQVVACNEHYDW